MRFDRLDILRYGALTDRVLDFRADASLHVIYGPNEAGKSSALAAISDLLFGFPRATAHYSFLHDAATLRIGAAITARGGSHLEFRRRRGTKNTLLSTDDKETTLSEDALSPYLGNLSRDVFERAFGLDSTRLRRGAAAMLQSGGEIGSLLFSAASGLTGLSNLRQSLESEADGIYAPRRSKDRTFYQVLDRYEDARKAERDNELRSPDWKKLVTEAAELEADIAALQAERHETGRALERLRRLKTLQPLIVEIDAENALLEEFSDLPAVPPGFETELEEALSAERQSAEALEAVREELARLQEELETAPVDAAAMTALGGIMEAHAEKGAYLKARQDLPAVRREAEDFEMKLGQLARRLGLGGGADEIERCQPSDAALVRLRGLVDEGRDLRREDGEIARRLEEEGGLLRRLERAQTSGRLIDPKPYAERLAALQPDIPDTARLDALQVRVSRAARELEEATARLSPAVADLDALLMAPLPDTTTLGEHRRNLDVAEAATCETAARLANLETERAELVAELAALERQGTIVTSAQIAEARGVRDALLRDAGAVPASEHRNRLATVEEAVREADRLADLALADAERISRHAQLALRAEGLDRRIAGARAAGDESRIALARAKSDFEALFAEAGVVPLAADRMIEWRRAVGELARQRDALRGLEDELSALRLLAQRAEPALASLGEAIGLYMAEPLPPSALARALSRHIDDIAERWATSREAEGKRLSLVESLARLDESRATMHSRVGRWQAEFGDAAKAVGLACDATVEMAETALDIWKDVPSAQSERQNRRRRVRGMERDTTGFEDRIRELLARVAPDLASLPVEAAADGLHRRAVAANADQQRRAGLLKAIEQTELRLARRMQDAGNAESALAALAEAVGGSGDLPALLQRLRDRRDLQARLAASRSRFLLQAEGTDESQLRASLAGFDRVAANLDIERLAEEDARQVARFGELSVRLAENRRQRQAMEVGTGAEYAVFEKHAAEQETRELARQWVILKLAAHMLNSSMEAYREQQADPVMMRAGQLFSVLTGGGFLRLVQDYGGDDELHLLAERAGGERVPIEGLSEGTGDQLYLALRLAFLEDYSARNEAPPLVVDDIFQTFDDTRTASGLRALAGTVGRFQTILFTHEMSVVDIARREIGAGLDLIVL